MTSSGGSVLLACLAILALAAWLVERTRARRAGARVASTADAHGAAIRLLRLTAEDQRNLALTLFGHAQSMRPADGALTGLARRLLDLSDDLGRQTELSGGARILSEEELFLLPVVEFAVSQVNAHLGPGRRAWRIDPALAGACLLADRRAVNQVLIHVLSGAAAATRDGDWIEIGIASGQDDFSIVVQDEGIGLPVAPAHGFREDGRGIGLRLTLARSLMQAHGGSLAVESAEHIGTRVRLRFPIGRLLHCQRVADPPGPAPGGASLVFGRLPSGSA
jgi:two-component system cell cycle sensor histidine kinase PleC